MERNISSLAIVLHSQRWGQINRRLTLLSVDYGLIGVVSYGAQKSRKAIKAEVFTDGQFFLYHNPVRGDYTLKDMQAISTHEELRDDLLLTWIGLFCCEMILKTHGGESVGEYQLLSRTLDLLSAQEHDPERVLIQFIHRLSGLLGVQGDLSRCPVCDRLYGPDEVICFSTTLVTQCCRECATVDGQLLLPPGARRYLSVTAEMDLGEAVGVELNPSAQARIKNYLLRYARLISLRELKTLDSEILWK
jgi:DNA repair protein RecO (recombination protein O)